MLTISIRLRLPIPPLLHILWFPSYHKGCGCYLPSNAWFSWLFWWHYIKSSKFKPRSPLTTHLSASLWFYLSVPTATSRTSFRGNLVMWPQNCNQSGQKVTGHTGRTINARLLSFLSNGGICNEPPKPTNLYTADRLAGCKHSLIYIPHRGSRLRFWWKWGELNPCPKHLATIFYRFSWYSDYSNSYFVCQQTICPVSL